MFENHITAEVLRILPGVRCECS